MLYEKLMLFITGTVKSRCFFISKSDYPNLPIAESSNVIVGNPHQRSIAMITKALYKGIALSKQYGLRNT